MIDDAVIYHTREYIAGVRPYFVLPGQDSVTYFDNHGGAPEAELITWAAQFLVPTKAFLDVGSHIGTWGITYALRGHGQVIGFEAQPWLARLANAGYALNGFQSKVQDHGLWHESDLLQLKAPYSDGGGGSVVVSTDKPEIIKSVLVRPLDAEYHHVGFMKIDVEGAELNVLKGAKVTISREKPTILLECWQDERGQNIEELFDYLDDCLDYRFTNVDGWPEMWLCEPN